MKGHARQLMTTKVELAYPATTVADAARELARLEVSALPIVDIAGTVIGIVTESDLLTALLRSIPVETPIRAIMRSPVVTVDEFAPADTVIRLLQEKGLHHLPVIRQGTVVGLITPQEVIRYFVEHQLPIPPKVA